MSVSLHSENEQQNGTKMSKEATLKTLQQSDNVSFYSICFDESNESEYEKFRGNRQNLG